MNSVRAIRAASNGFIACLGVIFVPSKGSLLPNGSRLSCGQTRPAASAVGERYPELARAQTLRFLDPRAARQLQALVRRLASRRVRRAGAMRLGGGAIRVAPAPHDASVMLLRAQVTHYNGTEVFAASRLTDRA